MIFATHSSTRFKQGFLLIGCAFLMGATPVEFAKIKSANIQRPTWSTDGTKLSFEANYYDTKRIATHVGDYRTKSHGEISNPSGQMNTLTSGFAKANTSKVVHELSWSPSAYGQYVYASTNEVGDYDIFLSGVGPIGASPFADGGPNWSPTSTEVVFTSSRTGDGDLYLLDAANPTLTPRRLTSHAGASEVYPTWSPDGKQLVYVAHSKLGDNLWWLPSTQHNPIRITRNEGSQTRPSFSPNGRDVAYYVKNETSGQFDIYVFTIGAPSEPKKIVSDVVPNTHGPVWSPDGRFMVYAKNDDARYDPLCATAIGWPERVIPLNVNTVGHSDLDVVQGAENTWRIAYVAQGTTNGEDRAFKRLYTVEIAPPKL